MNYFNGLKNVLPRLWNDRVRIVGIQPVKKGYITNNEDVTIVEDEPAKVVLKGQSPSEQSFFGTDEYDAKLIIRNGIKIPAGADIYEMVKRLDISVLVKDIVAILATRK